MDDDQRELASAVGTTLRTARLDADLTLNELAKRTGLSQPFLSQAENGRSLPSLINLHRVAQALGTTAHAILERSARIPTTLVEARVSRSFEVSPGAPVRFCAPGGRTMQPNEVTAAARTCADSSTVHPGEEFVYVVEGQVRIEVDGEEPYLLAAGDTLYYPATVPHRWFNDSDEQARFLMVSSPPGF